MSAETATTAEAADVAPPLTLCLFDCGPTTFAVGLDAVAEVIEVDRLVRLPGGPSYLLGLCALRREVIPVVSLGAGPESEPPAGAPTTVLILRTGQGPWALRVNAAGTSVTEADCLAPAFPEGQGPWAAFLGSIRRGGGCVGVIDPEATWRRLRDGAGLWYEREPKLSPSPGVPTETLSSLVPQ